MPPLSTPSNFMNNTLINTPISKNKISIHKTYWERDHTKGSTIATCTNAAKRAAIAQLHPTPHKLTRNLVASDNTWEANTKMIKLPPKQEQHPMTATVANENTRKDQTRLSDDDIARKGTPMSWLKNYATNTIHTAKLTHTLKRTTMGQAPPSWTDLPWTPSITKYKA